MSKRKTQYQKKKQKEKEAKRLLIGLISSGILLIAAALFLAFGGSSKDDGGTPVISVEQELIDYGDVKLSTEISFEIEVTNEGDGTLRFSEAPYIEVRDGC